jgi:hypothetical protein
MLIFYEAHRSERKTGATFPYDALGTSRTIAQMRLLRSPTEA